MMVSLVITSKRSWEHAPRMNTGVELDTTMSRKRFPWLFVGRDPLGRYRICFRTISSTTFEQIGMFPIQGRLYNVVDLLSTLGQVGRSIAITMELGHITSLTTSGTVGSRFVTQDELDDAKKAKEDEWKAAYER